MFEWTDRRDGMRWRVSVTSGRPGDRHAPGIVTVVFRAREECHSLTSPILPHPNDHDTLETLIDLAYESVDVEIADPTP